MAKLQNLNRFVYAPQVNDIGRSRFSRPFTHKTTMVAGDIVPIYCDEVLPHDTWSIDLSHVIRSLTPAVPVMDNAFIDFYAFFVPMRLCTKGSDDWQKICGQKEPDESYADDVEYTMENTGNIHDWKSNPIESMSVLNYLGIPVLAGDRSEYLKINDTRVRGLIKIYNDWFRDQNIQNSLNFEDLSSGSGDAFTLRSAYPFKANKFHDYFTSGLPAPQKGPSVLLPLLGEAPVVALEDEYTPQGTIKQAVKVRNISGNVPANKTLVTSSGLLSQDATSTPSVGGGAHLYFSNLYADLSEVTGATINQLRLSFAIQRMFEKDARGGTRYIEVLQNHFHCAPIDETLQRPKYLGGKRVPLQMTQVLQSVGLDSAPLGATGAFSNTSDTSKLVISSSFEEYGYIYVCAIIRTSQTYSQGISRDWFRNRRFDYYWPVFANLGEQATLKRELFYDGNNNAKSEEVFNYQEAWAEYRYHPSMVTGNLAPNANDLLLTPWTYALKLTDYPVFNEAFLRQDRKQIDDTLAVDNSPYQYICDFYFDCDVTRPMPLYSIPGLIDHH